MEALFGGHGRLVAERRFASFQRAPLPAAGDKDLLHGAPEKADEVSLAFDGRLDAQIAHFEGRGFGKGAGSASGASMSRRFVVLLLLAWVGNGSSCAQSYPAPPGAVIKAALAASNDTHKGRQENWRVELVISGDVIGTAIGRPLVLQ